MPCRGPESDMFSRSEMERKVEQAEDRVRSEMSSPIEMAKVRLEQDARFLRDWLETQLQLKHDNSETAKLCAAIRVVGEEQFLDFVVKRARDSEEARRLIGWWEEHKRIDKLEGR